MTYYLSTSITLICRKEIDDAEWLGEFERADSVKIELEHIKRMINNGELWYPTF